MKRNWLDAFRGSKLEGSSAWSAASPPLAEHIGEVSTRTEHRHRTGTEYPRNRGNSKNAMKTLKMFTKLAVWRFGHRSFIKSTERSEAEKTAMILRILIWRLSWLSDMAFGTSGLNGRRTFVLTGERPCEHSEEILVQKTEVENVFQSSLTTSIRYIRFQWTSMGPKWLEKAKLYLRLLTVSKRFRSELRPPSLSLSLSESLSNAYTTNSVKIIKLIWNFNHKKCKLKHGNNIKF